MPNLDLTDEEHAALLRLVKQATVIRCRRGSILSGRSCEAGAAAGP
jgi:hypothetical protein